MNGMKTKEKLGLFTSVAAQIDIFQGNMLFFKIFWLAKYIHIKHMSYKYNLLWMFFNEVILYNIFFLKWDEIKWVL